MSYKKFFWLVAGLLVFYRELLFVNAEFCSPFNINLSVKPSVLNISDGCSGEISFAPINNFNMNVCLINASNDLVVHCENFVSGVYGVNDDILVYPSSAVEGGNYYFNISWSRIKYVDMSNPVINGKFDRGEVRKICPTSKTSNFAWNYQGVSQGVSACNYEALLRDKNYSSAGQFSTGSIQMWTSDGCVGTSKLDDDFFDSDFSNGARVPEDNSYQPTFTCQAGAGAVFESYWNVGVFSCVSGFGYDNVLNVDSCVNGASAPSGVCNSASGSVKTSSFPIVYNNDSRVVYDLFGFLDVSAVVSWNNQNGSVCVTDGVYNFNSFENLSLFSFNNDSIPDLVLNLTITDNVSLQQNPVNVTSVKVNISWLADGVPTVCGGGCPESVVLVNDTSFQVVSVVDGSDLEVGVVYSASVVYQQVGGQAVYSDVSNDAYADPNVFPDPCGDGFCDSSIGENGFSCAFDCHSGSSGAFNNDGSSFLGSGQVGTGLENLYTGKILTVSGNIASGVGVGYHDWTFRFINRVRVG